MHLTFMRISRRLNSLEDIRAYSLGCNLVGKGFLLLNRLRLRNYKAAEDRRMLEFVASHDIRLLELHFHDYGITRDADEFPTTNTGSLSAAPSPLPPVRPLDLHDPTALTFLTPAQWTLLAPLLPPASVTEPGDRRERSRSVAAGPMPVSRGRGRAPSDPRALLDAVFWKLATGLPWSALPPFLPSAATCRRYYRRLWWSGRLMTVYAALFHHAREQGLHLFDLVEQSCFILEPRRRLALRPDLAVTWKHRTALLFMQLGAQVYRRRKREFQLEQRLRNPSCRLPPLTRTPSLETPPRPARTEAQEKLRLTFLELFLKYGEKVAHKSPEFHLPGLGTNQTLFESCCGPPG